MDHAQSRGEHRVDDRGRPVPVGFLYAAAPNGDRWWHIPLDPMTLKDARLACALIRRGGSLGWPVGVLGPSAHVFSQAVVVPVPADWAGPRDPPADRLTRREMDALLRERGGVAA